MVEVFPVHIVTISLNKLEYLPRVTLELVSFAAVRAGVTQCSPTLRDSGSSGCVGDYS